MMDLAYYNDDIVYFMYKECWGYMGTNLADMDSGMYVG